MTSFKDICRFLFSAAFVLICFSGLAAGKQGCCNDSLSERQGKPEVSVIGDMHLAGLSMVREFKSNLREILQDDDLDDDTWEWAGGFIVYFDILPDFTISNLKFCPEGLNKSLKAAVIKGIQAIDFSKFKTIGNIDHEIRLVAKIDIVKLAHGLE